MPRQTVKNVSRPAASWYEAEVVPGLESSARAELGRLGVDLRSVESKKGALRFSFDGGAHVLERSGTAQAIYSVQTYDIPRPLALLGDQHWRRFIAQIQAVLGRHTFKSFHLAASGDQSSVMQRLKTTLAEHLNLRHDDEEGDLWIRIIRPPDKQGWETLVRISPRPLATRAWRVCNFKGALNATVARMMLDRLQLDRLETLVNIGSGSGTFQVEARMAGFQGSIIGVDFDPDVMACAQENISAAKLKKPVTTITADITRLPFATASLPALISDLPFGQHVGSHRDNQVLYPRLMREAARVAQPQGKFILITHELKLIDQTLIEQAEHWRIQETYQITLRGLHPKIYVLQRQPS